MPASSGSEARQHEERERKLERESAKEKSENATPKKVIVFVSSFSVSLILPLHKQYKNVTFLFVRAVLARRGGFVTVFRFLFNTAALANILLVVVVDFLPPFFVGLVQSRWFVAVVFLAARCSMLVVVSLRRCCLFVCVCL